MKRFALLAGVRDTWHREDPGWEEACWQAEALRFYGLSYFLNALCEDAEEEVGLHRHDPWLTEQELELGKLLYTKRLDSVKRKAAAVWILDGVAYMNSLDVSDVAEELRVAGSEAKMLAGFAFKTDSSTGELQLVWSLRSIDPKVDVGALAKRRGGGGHTQAAGFTERALSLDGYRGGYPFEGLLIPPRFPSLGLG